MKHTILLLLSLLPACSGAVPVYWIDARATPLPEGELPFDRVREACEFWGLHCEDTDDDQGALFLILDDAGGENAHGERQLGQTLDSPCDPFVWAADVATAPEHELGHGFGLKHTDTRNNLMNRATTLFTTETTERQENQVQRAADALIACPGNEGL